MIIGRFRGRESSFLSSRLFAKVTTCRGRFANHSPLILQKSFLPTNILIYAAEPFIFSTFAWFFTSERPGSSNRLTRVVQSNDPGYSFGRPESFTYRKTLPREETSMLNALKPIDMAILYDWYENPGTNEEAPEERGLHPRPLLNGKVTMRQLYNRVHARSSLTVGDVMNAIDCLAQICGEELRDGHEVHIEGLGYFAPTLEATQKVTHSTPNKHLKLRLKSISFRPDVRLKQAMTGSVPSAANHPPLPEAFGSGDRHEAERILCRPRRADSQRLPGAVRHGAHHRERPPETVAARGS